MLFPFASPSVMLVRPIGASDPVPNRPLSHSRTVGGVEALNGVKNPSSKVCWITSVAFTEPAHPSTNISAAAALFIVLSAWK